MDAEPQNEEDDADQEDSETIQFGVHQKSFEFVSFGEGEGGLLRLHLNVTNIVENFSLLEYIYILKNRFEDYAKGAGG